MIKIMLAVCMLSACYASNLRDEANKSRYILPPPPPPPASNQANLPDPNSEEGKMLLDFLKRFEEMANTKYPKTTLNNLPPPPPLNNLPPPPPISALNLPPPPPLGSLNLPPPPPGSLPPPPPGLITAPVESDPLKELVNKDPKALSIKNEQYIGFRGNLYAQDTILAAIEKHLKGEQKETQKAAFEQFFKDKKIAKTLGQQAPVADNAVNTQNTGQTALTPEQKEFQTWFENDVGEFKDTMINGNNITCGNQGNDKTYPIDEFVKLLDENMPTDYAKTAKYGAFKNKLINVKNNKIKECIIAIKGQEEGFTVNKNGEKITLTINGEAFEESDKKMKELLDKIPGTLLVGNNDEQTQYNNKLKQIKDAVDLIIQYDANSLYARNEFDSEKALKDAIKKEIEKIHLNQFNPNVDDLDEVEVENVGDNITLKIKDGPKFTGTKEEIKALLNSLTVHNPNNLINIQTQNKQIVARKKPILEMIDGTYDRKEYED